MLGAWFATVRAAIIARRARRRRPPHAPDDARRKPAHDPAGAADPAAAHEGSDAGAAEASASTETDASTTADDATGSQAAVATLVALRRRRAAAEQKAQLSGGLRMVLSVASIVVLSGALPAFLLADVPSNPRSGAWVITLLIMIWAGIRLSLRWVDGTPRLFDFFFWLFVYVFMGLAPTAQIRSGLTSTTTPGVPTPLDAATAGIVVLGLVCYELARVFSGLRERQRTARRPRAPAPEEAWLRGVSGGRTAALVVVAFALSAYVLSQLGPTALLGNREALVAARAAAWPDSAVRGLAYASGIFPLLVAVGALGQLRRATDSRAVRAVAGVTAVVGGVVLLLIVNPVSSARYTFGTVAFALLVYAGAVATRKRARVTMLATILGFLFLFPIADAFRRADSSADRSGFFDEYLSNPDYDAFWQIANAVSYWVEGHVVVLSQFVGSVLFWVPRSLWPGKPTDTGVLLAQYRGYSFDNLSAPLWAEGMVNVGILGVVVLFVLLGVAVRVMDGRIVLAFSRGGVWAVVGAILPVYLTILLRGSLLQATGALTLTILCLLVIRGPGRMLVPRERERQREPTRKPVPTPATDRVARARQR